MSNPMKFGLIAVVVIAVVALGYHLSQKRKEAAGTAPKPNYFIGADGKPDYTKNADGTPKPFA